MTTILKIYPDMDPESPREWDNLGTMACWHDRYDLGDEQPNDSPTEYMEMLVDEKDPGFIDRMEQKAEEHFEGRPYEDQAALREWDEYWKTKVHEAFEKHYISLPLYAYEHGAITISTGGFSCPWDSGQIGFIYVARDSLDKERITEEEAIANLKAEVEEYDQYLQGDVWEFVLEEDGEEVDSCGGFFGDDWRKNGMADHVNADQIDEVWRMEPRMVNTFKPADKEVLT